MSELHKISAERYLTGSGWADRADPECEWTCTCGASGIVGGRWVSKAEEAGNRHLLEVHGQQPSIEDRSNT